MAGATSFTTGRKRSPSAVDVPTSKNTGNSNCPSPTTNTENDTILDYSLKKPAKSSKSDYDHNIVTIISDTRTSNQHSRSYHSRSSHNAQYQSRFDEFQHHFGTRTNFNHPEFHAPSAFLPFSRHYAFNGDSDYGGYFRGMSQSPVHESFSQETQLQPPPQQRHINSLFPELLATIFVHLDTQDKGRAAQVCKYWREISYEKRIWKGIEAKVHLQSKGNSTLYQSLTRRGVHQIQILSLKKSLRELFVGLPNLTSLKLSGCYNVTDWTLFSTFTTSNSNFLLPIQNTLTRNDDPSSSNSSSGTRPYPAPAPAPNAILHYPVQYQLHALTTLDLSLCKQVSDISLGRIAIRAPNLQSLELGGCCQITDRGLLIIAWGFKKLARLNLRSCHLISDVGIGYLSGLVTAEHLHEPKTLDFLTKFGLVQLSNTVNLNGTHLNSSASDLIQASSTGSLQYEEPPKPKRSRKDHGSDRKAAPRRQQCSLCHQLILNPKQSSSSSAGFVPGLGVSSASDETLPDTGNKRRRKLVCKKYLMNTTLDNCQRIINGAIGDSTNLPIPNNASNVNVISVGFEKIGPNTEFGTRNLQSLVLQDCQKLTDTCLSYISPFSAGTSSFFFSAVPDPEPTSSSTAPAAKGLLNLESINLSFCIHITDSGLKQLAKLPKLSELNLRSCDSITDHGLANLRECGSRLATLDVSFCDKINNVALSHIACWMSSLKSLSVSSCHISDSGLLKIAQSLSQLETLHLGQCSKITDESIKCIASKCRRLKYMDLYGCNKISKEGLEVLLKLSSIVSLNLGL